MPKIKLKKGDKVKVITGKSKGKSGKVLEVDPKNNRVIVEGVNMMTKHVKPNRQQQGGQGGIIHQEAPIHASNVMYLAGDKPSRIGYTMTGDKKVRIAKATGEIID